MKWYKYLSMISRNGCLICPVYIEEKKNLDKQGIFTFGERITSHAKNNNFGRI